ncbi:MAG: cyclopropane-fatty-acyl-phospholipid synthase family protein [Sphingorhabdus sp.]
MRVANPVFRRLLDRIDSGIAAGSIDGRLPDGSPRMLGGRQPGPVAIVHLKSWRALLRLARAGSVGWYEAWAAGEWESPDPVQLFDLFMRNRMELGKAARPSGLMRLIGNAIHWGRRNSKSGARKNIEYHYDLGNDFYAAWLDETMTYSSAVFANPDNSDEPFADAQHRKNDRLLDRLQLADGDSLLEIGCGWGGLADQALRRLDIRYHGITLSAEQKAYTDKRLSRYSDSASVTITDYRDVTGQYDAIASVEMVEAVGQHYWPAYLDSIARCLKPGGRAAIQYIRIEDDVFDAYAQGQDFIQRYIFPGGMLLSESRFRQLAEASGLKWHGQQDFGLHYAKTLRLWRERFDRAVDNGQLSAEFDTKFARLWRYYLMYCEGGFRGGGINVAQVTLIKE